MLSSHRLSGVPNVRLPRGLPTKLLNSFIVSPIQVTCTAQRQSNNIKWPTQITVSHYEIT